VSAAVHNDAVCTVDMLCRVLPARDVLSGVLVRQQRVQQCNLDKHVVCHVMSSAKPSSCASMMIV
jgi:hypothetical protein